MLCCWWKDFANLGVKKLCVMADKNVICLPGMKTIMESLHHSAIDFDVYSNVCIEPTDKRFVLCVCINICAVWVPATVRIARFISKF